MPKLSAGSIRERSDDSCASFSLYQESSVCAAQPHLRTHLMWRDRDAAADIELQRLVNRHA